MNLQELKLTGLFSFCKSSWKLAKALYKMFARTILSEKCRDYFMWPIYFYMYSSFIQHSHVSASLLKWTKVSIFLFSLKSMWMFWRKYVISGNKSTKEMVAKILDHSRIFVKICYQKSQLFLKKSWFFPYNLVCLNFKKLICVIVR